MVAHRKQCGQSIRVVLQRSNGTACCHGAASEKQQELRLEWLRACSSSSGNSSGSNRACCRWGRTGWGWQEYELA